MSAATEKSIPARLNSPASQATVRLVRAEELPAHVEAWQRLADRALFPNISYEPWMVMPVLEAGADTRKLYFAFIVGPGDQELWGFFPLEVQSWCLHLPIGNVALWQHRYSYVTAPLLHADHAREALGAFWRWFEKNPLGAHVLDTNWLLADGPFHHLWVDFAMGRVSLMLNDFPRGLYRTGMPLAEYLAQVVSRKGANEFQRRERRLADLGRLEYRTVNTAQEADQWVEDFLALESAGWKGGTGGRAFATYQPDAAYFRLITREAFRRGRALLMSMVLNGKPIAMRHTLLAGSGAYAFRTAYDESYGKHSPGKLLELQMMQRLNAQPGVEWMDSCAAPRHAMFNRIWHERRMIRRTLISDGTLSGDSFLSALPLIRWAGKMIRPRKLPDYLKISTQGDPL